MIGQLLGGLVGLINPLGRIVDKLTDVNVRLAAEKNETARIALESERSVLQARRDIILAAQSDPMERWVRIGFALPFILYVVKVVAWDKVLGWGATDNLSPDLWNILYIVLAGYFVDAAVKRFKS